jgi:hypothetical protein
MFKNSRNDGDAKAGHTCSGRSLINFPLTELFKQGYGPLNQDKYFYSEEEAGRSDEEYSESARIEEVETKELR